MADKIRVAFLSFWHSHAAANPEIGFRGAGIYGTVAAHPDIEVVAAWDDVAERGRQGAERLGVPFEPDLQALLSRPDLDGVVVINETTRHGELCIAAARAGKHVYVTKVLAPTLAEASAIVAACDEAGVVLVTMLSRLYEPWAIKIRDIIASGELGTLICLKIWHAHGLATRYSEADGAGYLPDGHGFLTRRDGGGGAYIDMCHPQYLTPFLVGGMPATAYARMTSVSGRGDVEDNAVAILDYPHGPYVVLEEGWASAPTTTYVEVQGTDGTCLYRDDKGDPSRAFFCLRSGQDATFRDLPLGTVTDSPLDEWIRHIRAGTRPDDNIERTLQLSQLNEAAYLSAERGAPVAIASVTA
jgi:1,5-anhydro-D-fructose reductase (1,5-anhydro-D-mannitol-forming)